VRDDDDEAVGAVHNDLVQAGWLVPVAEGGDEETAFLDCDLASLAEHRLGDRVDPRALDPARRARWIAEATTERLPTLRSRGTYERCYWIVEDGERVGTVALDLGALGGARVRLASFYVFPPRRGRGAGRRTLHRIAAAAAAHRLSLRLETSWTWQRTVRFYLSSGMWVHMWKRDLTLFWAADLPPYRIVIDDSTARFDVDLGARSLTLARARREGGGPTLVLDEASREIREGSGLGAAFWHATSTFALALALRGWPLVRSPEDWERHHYSDGGAPEGLAYKIAVWEAWDQNHGWIVETPRIPGLEYPTWDELTARWEREYTELTTSSTAG
jgi:GNAT superfamily N-acetyltransferase